MHPRALSHQWTSRDRFARAAHATLLSLTFSPEESRRVAMHIANALEATRTEGAKGASLPPGMSRDDLACDLLAGEPFLSHVQRFGRALVAMTEEEEEQPPAKAKKKAAKSGPVGLDVSIPDSINAELHDFAREIWAASDGFFDEVSRHEHAALLVQWRKEWERVRGLKTSGLREEREKVYPRARIGFQEAPKPPALEDEITTWGLP